MSDHPTKRATPTDRDSSLIVPLESAHTAPVDQVGIKAANLGRLISAGFRVPDGIVLTTSALPDANLNVTLANNHADTNDLQLPVDVVDAIERKLESLDGAQFAVRSSGVEEDLAGSSFAGQYDSVLGVSGSEDVQIAVQRCLASGSSQRVRAYRGHRADDGRSPLAVIVQRLIDADAAGVAFSANPVTGDRDEVIVSAVNGLGDRLVAGEVTPDEWVVGDDRVEAGSQPEQALTEAEVREVARLTEQIEEEFGEPQDVEWAIRDGEIYVLQSRPITGLPQPPAVDLPKPGTWIKDTSHYPEPMTPFGASVFLPALETGLQTMTAEFGVIVDRVEQRSIGGEVYGRPVPVGENHGSPPPWWLMAILARILPPMRERLSSANRAIGRGLIEHLPEQWEQHDRAMFRDEADRLRSVDLSSLNDRELLDHLDAAVDLLRTGQVVHFRLFLPYAIPLYELVIVCEELLGWDTLETMNLLSGLSETSSEPSRALVTLAEQIREVPAARDVIESGGHNVREHLVQVDASVADAFDAYVTNFGHRSINYDPGARTLAERPELLAGLLSDAIVRGPTSGAADELLETRTEAERRARELLSGRSELDRKRFETTLTLARRNYPLREDNIFWTDNIPCGVVRGILVEIGRRLHEHGSIQNATDAQFLEVDEIRDALGANPGHVLSDLVSRRRAEQAWVEAHPGPAFLGDPPAPFPDIRGLPESARRTNGALMWLMGHEYGSAPEQVESSALIGVPGSPGRYTGTVRVIRTEEDFGRLRPDDILVCPVTTPTWSVLFPNAQALVTDGGGTLSHAAIIAREYGIPAVLGTQSATRELHDGQVVTVDGTSGRVIVTGSERTKSHFQRGGYSCDAS